MKHRKIGQQLANDIAAAVADKAFEHLIPAAQKRAEATSRLAYAKLASLFDLEALYKIEVCAKGGTCSIRVRPEGDPSDGNLTHASISAADVFCFRTWTAPIIDDTPIHEQLVEVRAELARLIKNHAELRKELRLQLIGKTTKQALEAWPEAAEIIASVAALDETGDFVKPLETLLAKFLPALPAPAGQGV